MVVYNRLKIIVPALTLGLFVAIPVFGQESAPAANSSPSASTEMKSAGQNMEQIGSDTAAAATDVERGTVTAVKDSTVTARVKKAIHGDSTLSSSTIHVSTVAGTVTLKGEASSSEASDRAEQLAQQTRGVKNVDNKLAVLNSSSSPDSKGSM